MKTGGGDSRALIGLRAADNVTWMNRRVTNEPLSERLFCIVIEKEHRLSHLTYMYCRVLFRDNVLAISCLALVSKHKLAELQLLKIRKFSGDQWPTLFQAEEWLTRSTDVNRSSFGLEAEAIQNDSGTDLCHDKAPAFVCVSTERLE